MNCRFIDQERVSAGTREEKYNRQKYDRECEDQRSSHVVSEHSGGGKHRAYQYARPENAARWTCHNRIPQQLRSVLMPCELPLPRGNPERVKMIEDQPWQYCGEACQKGGASAPSSDEYYGKGQGGKVQYQCIVLRPHSACDHDAGRYPFFSQNGSNRRDNESF